MSVLEYIDSSVFNPVFQNDIPLVPSPRIEAICKELSFAIRNNEEIFIYGDYDMDGFCSVMVWKEVLTSLSCPSPVVFNYRARTHSIDLDILEQVCATRARVILICDTGSSLEDKQILSLLASAGRTTVVIDHHVYMGDYKVECSHRLVFNSYEEKALLGGEVSGAYASLLVAKVLCEKFMSAVVPFSAKVYALGSMYSDSVDMSTDIARALYNTVAIAKAKGPQFLHQLNQWNYLYGRRFFSYIVAPKVNGCFRMERLELLNRVLQVNDRFRMQSVCTELVSMHEEARKLTAILSKEFTREYHGNIVLCIHETSETTRSLHVRNFTGVIATRIAAEEHSLVVVVVKDSRHYEGSVRDYYGRSVLNSFRLICEAGGHDAAFGISFADLAEFRRRIDLLSRHLAEDYTKSYVTLNSGLIESEADINALALYNEYMNVLPSVEIAHTCRNVRLLRSTSYNYYYSVGLPTEIPLMTKRPLIDGSTILIEPTICRGVELREKE